jgi:hypothetical protein
VTGADDRVVPDDELSTDDRAALGWAVSSDHPVAVALVQRVRSGGSSVSAGELAAVRADWERNGRPAPAHHVHRDPLVLPDGAVVTGVTFVDDDPYRRDTPPAFGLYLDPR